MELKNVKTRKSSKEILDKQIKVLKERQAHKMDPKNSTRIDFKIKNNTTEIIVVGQRA